MDRGSVLKYIPPPSFLIRFGKVRLKVSAMLESNAHTASHTPNFVKLQLMLDNYPSRRDKDLYKGYYLYYFSPPKLSTEKVIDLSKLKLTKLTSKQEKELYDKIKDWIEKDPDFQNKIKVHQIYNALYHLNTFVEKFNDLSVVLDKLLEETGIELDREIDD